MCCGTFSFTTCRSSLSVRTVSAIRNWERVRVFMGNETVSEGDNGWSFFSFRIIQQLDSMLPTSSTTFDASSTATSEDSTSRMLMFRFLPTGRILRGSIVPEELFDSKSSAFPAPLSRHLHVALPLAQCHHQVGQILALLCHIRFPTAQNWSQYFFLLASPPRSRRY